jgi:hypothetical protein
MNPTTFRYGWTTRNLMKKRFNLLVILVLPWLAACAGGNNPPPTGSAGISTEIAATPAQATAATFPPTIRPSTAFTATPTASPSQTLSPTPSATPTLSPDAWQSLPVVPVAGENARLIYQDGLGFGNDPHAFSILGDCLSLPENFLGVFGRGLGQYHLGDFYYLQPAIDQFRASFSRQSISNGNGFNSAAVLSPLRANPRLCLAGENPMACEYRVHHPSFALIALGTDDNTVPPETFEKRIREIVEYTISSGVVPILATKADNREGENAFNRIIANLSYEYGVPLWNFWAAAQPLPLQGLVDNRGHLTGGNPGDFESPGSLNHGATVRSLTALQALDAVWHGVTAP